MCTVHVKPPSSARALSTRLFPQISWMIVLFYYSELEKPTTGFSFQCRRTCLGWRGGLRALFPLLSDTWVQKSPSELQAHASSLRKQARPPGRPALDPALRLCVRAAVVEDSWPAGPGRGPEGIWVYACVILRGQRSGYGAHKARLFPRQQEGRALSICCLHSLQHT